MDNNLGFKLKRRRGLVIETLHLDEGGGTNERRTTPSETQNEINKAPAVGQIPPTATHSHSHVTMGNATEPQAAPGKKKLERRKIRFDDDPNENPSGILGMNTAKATSAPNIKKSSLRTDKPELYDF